MKHKLHYLTVLLCFTMFTVKAQDRTVTGTVTSSEDKTAVPGVNVVVKGTAIGTITDLDGKYSIDVPSDESILVFSYIGLATQEVQVGALSIMDIAMITDLTELTQIVVTAVGIERDKLALGYSVAKVESESIQQRAEPDPVRALQGKVAGVNIIGSGGAVGEGTNITIRGNSSLLGNNQPLFVVDGIPFDNTTYSTGSFTSRTTASSRSFDLDPNNIESMTVLKGAAAAALYGSRAANGVIVVTTKAGKKGTKKGLEITVNSGYQIEEVANLPDYQTRYTQGNNFKYVDGNYGTWGAPFDVSHPYWQNPLNANLLLSVSPDGTAWVDHPYDRYPTRFPQHVGDSIPLYPNLPAKQFFEQGFLFENGVTVSGGNDKASIVAGFSHMKNAGIVPENEVQRISMNIGGNVQLDNGFFLSGNFSYVNTDMTSPPTAGLLTGGTSVTERTLFAPPNVDLAGLPYIDSEGNGAFYRPDNDNPIFLSKYAPHTSVVNRYYGSAMIGYEVNDWLTITYKAGINGFTDSKLNVLPISTNVQPVGQMISDEIRRMEIDANLLFNFNYDINDDINLKAILGHNMNSRETNRQSVKGTGIIVRGINDLDNVESVIPNGSYTNKQRYHAFFGDVTVGYKDWVFLNVTGRNDITSTLPKDNRSYFYGGASGSFIFTKALNIESSTFNFGKVRIGYASVGNDTDPYLLDTYYFTNSGLGNNIASLDYPFNGANAQTLGSRIGNANLKPEKTTEIEAGIDLQFFNSRIGLDFTYYDRSSKDQIVPIDIAPTSGYSSAWTNLGEITNEGVEIALKLTPLQTNSGFTWDIYTVFTKNKNLVKSIGHGLEEVFVNGFGDSERVVHVEGEEYGQVKGSVAAKHTDGQLLVDPSTGKLIEETELEIIANPNPNYMLGVTNTFQYKGFSFNFLIDYRDGGQMFSGTYNQIFGRGLTTETIPDNPLGREVTVVIPGVLGDPSTFEAILDENGAVIPNGTQLTVNDWYFINTFGSAGPSEFSVFDATTVRLREVSLTYDFPQSLL
ncbi:MAG: SusC/RagA family TonB-linked outer membrane protein, partial [Cyclobacteriaceae bacterium]|nr:SusC/RagA family TonB-linked outer membrane protein [Cyclobacteriaceae bacterium]